MNNISDDKTKFITIEGIIDMSKAPKSGQDFLSNLNGWLGEENWMFVGSVGVPKPDEAKEISKLQMAKSIYRTVIGFAQLVFGAAFMAMAVRNGNGIIGVMAMILIWNAGIKFGRSSKNG